MQKYELKSALYLILMELASKNLFFSPCTIWGVRNVYSKFSSILKSLIDWNYQHMVLVRSNTLSLTEKFQEP